MLFAIASEGHRLVLEAMRAADAQARTEPSVTWTDRLRAVVAAFAQWQARESRLARVVQYEMRSLSREHFHEIAAVRAETTSLVTDLVEGGIVAGEFGINEGGDAVLAIMSLCVDVCRWFPARGYRDPDAVGAVYANLAASLVESRLR
ncbi:putative TetR family transcriptional regulator [Gordonia effusa NBRC 100432]|uniref:Putative TetR family transcriptional regulator n=1 Tax=Gordonia effusa NBRC 100432 TaxID=1077974 RepID=H0R5T1_9ACTN|nr:putative TetR family transcriptional regulator [Gordonia effusa NBRC 100432]